MTYRNLPLYSWFSTLDPDHQANLQLVYQYNSQDTHTVIQYQDTKVLISYQYTHTVIQCQNPKIPICTDIPMQFFQLSNHKANQACKSGESSLCQCEVYRLNQPTHSDSSYHFAYKLLFEIPSRTCHLYHLFTSKHFLVYPWYIQATWRGRNTKTKIPNLSL